VSGKMEFKMTPEFIFYQMVKSEKEDGKEKIEKNGLI